MISYFWDLSEKSLREQKIKNSQIVKRFLIWNIFPAETIKASSILFPVGWIHSVHAQRNHQTIILLQCCKQKDTYAFSKYTVHFYSIVIYSIQHSSFVFFLNVPYLVLVVKKCKLTYRKNLSFQMIEISLLSRFIERCHACSIKLLQFLLLNVKKTIMKNIAKISVLQFAFCV